MGISFCFFSVYLTYGRMKSLLKFSPEINKAFPAFPTFPVSFVAFVALFLQNKQIKF